MIIDATNLHEVLPLGTHCKFKDERWFQVPGHDDLAFSTHCQLAQRQSNGRWRRIRRRYLLCAKKNRSPQYPDKRRECFHVNGEKLFVENLVHDVFFPNLDVWRIVPQATLIHRGKPDSADELLKRVEDTHILFTPSEYSEYIASKCEGRKPNYPEEQQRHTFVNLKKSPREIEWVRNNIKQRSRKKGILFCEEWEDHSAFLTWYYQNDYQYTGRYSNVSKKTNLDCDSDLLTLGQRKAYSPATCCFLPSSINVKVVSQQRLSTSKQCARNIARLDEVLAYEEPRGEIPAYILQKLEQLRSEYQTKQRELEAKEQTERKRKETERQRAKEQRAHERQKKKGAKKN